MNTCADKGKQNSQDLVTKAKEYQSVLLTQGLKQRLALALAADKELQQSKASLEEAKSQKEKLVKSKEMAAVLAEEYKQLNSEGETTHRAQGLSEKLDTQVQTLDNEITRLKDIVDKDYGPYHEFFSLRNQCISSTSNQYTYRFCFYQNAEQLENEKSVNLGQWKGFKNQYQEIAFEDGTRCFRGPARSISLKLECGETNEILKVEEPETCVYTAKFRTPAACTAERFEELLKSTQF